MQQKSSEYKNLNDYERDLVYSKQVAEWNLDNVSGSEVSLSDLRMENGKIIGLTPELEELFYGTKEGMSEDDIRGWETSRKGIEFLLNAGLENIPDIPTRLTYSKDELTYVG